MAKRSTLTLTLNIDGARGTLAAMRKLPKEASDELRNASLRLSQSLAARVQAAARADSPQSALMAPTVKARRDRVPAIVAGGTRRVGRKRAPAYGILFGSEFGANRRTGWYAQPRYASSEGRQFRRHLGRGSYWFFRTVDDEQTRISREWQRAADNVVRAFGGGGDGG